VEYVNRFIHKECNINVNAPNPNPLPPTSSNPNKTAAPFAGAPPSRLFAG
jgi:hypothetical protein